MEIWVELTLDEEPLKLMNLKQSRAYYSRDFAWRKRHDPGNVTLAENYGEYIHIHPFVDEAIEEGAGREIMEMCYRVDAWWKNRGMMVFLRVTSSSARAGSEPGYYAGWDRSHGMALLKLTAIVEESLIHRSTFHAVLREFSRFGVFYPRVYKKLWRESGEVGRLPL